MPNKRLTPSQRFKTLSKVSLSTALDSLSIDSIERRLNEETPNVPTLTDAEIQEQVSRAMERGYLDLSQRSGPTIGEMYQGIDESRILEPFSALAGHALRERFLTQPYEDAITAAFEHFKLDRENPSNWRLLIGILAYSFFGDPRKPGRKKYWTAERYCQLLEDVDRLKSKHPRLSDSRACALLKRADLKDRYEDQSGDRLADLLREARDASYNAELRELVLQDGMRQKAERIRLKLQDFSAEEESELIIELEKKYSEVIARRWRGEHRKNSHPGK